MAVSSRRLPQRRPTAAYTDGADGSGWMSVPTASKKMTGGREKARGIGSRGIELFLEASEAALHLADEELQTPARLLQTRTGFAIGSHRLAELIQFDRVTVGLI